MNNILTKDTRFVEFETQADSPLGAGQKFLVLYADEDRQALQLEYPEHVIFKPNELLSLKGKSREHCCKVFLTMQTWKGSRVKA